MRECVGKARNIYAERCALNPGKASHGFLTLAMLAFVLLLEIFLVAADASTVRVVETTDMPSYNYCSVQEPTHLHTFDFSVLSDDVNDKLIRLDHSSSFRLHFCRPLVKPCNGKYGYSVCYNKTGKEIGVGKEPPEIDLSDGKVMFKYTGDSCNATHNYTINFEMKCNYMMKKEVAIDIDITNRTEKCNFNIVLETAAACTKRKQIDCIVKDASGRYNLNPLTDYTKNYEVVISDETSVVLNVCHSLLYGPHHVNCSSDSSICLIDKTDKSNIRYKNIGKIEDKTFIYVSDGNLLINYDSDVLCYLRHIEHFQTIKTTIKFVCDLNATDTSPEFMGGWEICHYKFVWRTIAACSEKVLHEQSLVNRDFCTVKDPLTKYEYDLSIFKNRIFRTRTMDGVYAISICSFMNGTICKTGTGVCKEFDEKRLGISGGLANGELMWKASGPYLNYTDGNVCAKGLKKFTVISFLCAFSDWIDVEDKACHTNINWYTSAICKKPCAMSLYDMNFERLIRSKSNYVVQTNSSTVFHINVCRPLVNGSQFQNCTNGVGICKADIDKDGKSTNELNLGYPDQNLHGESDGSVVLTYKNGALCEEDKEQRTSSQIKFVCDLDHFEGAPHFVDYHNCTYYFEWKTKLSCGAVEGNVNGECQVTNAHGDMWDLSELNKRNVYKFSRMKQDGNHTFSVSLCGGKKACNDSYVCDDKMSYGKKMTVMSDYRTNTIKFHFTDGSPCADGSKAQSILNIKCNESAILGEPSVLTDQYCNSEFEWSTNAICRPQNLLLPKDIQSVQISSTEISNDDSTSTVQTILIVLLAVFILCIIVCFFHRASRRTLCMMYIYNVFRRCPFCSEYPEPTDNLCL